MMGNPSEVNGMNGGVGGYGPSGVTQAARYREQQKATFSGMTALIGVVALVVDIVAVAVPHWGYYSPLGPGYYSQGLPSQDNTGHFGPFQSCKYAAYYSFCGSDTYFQASSWLLAAGVCAVFSVIALAAFCLFSILHVSMQLQRREIMVSFSRAVFLKFVTACIAEVMLILAVVLGALQFTLEGRTTSLYYKMGICYYLLIMLIFVVALLAVLSFLSYRKARRDPMPMVPRHQPSVQYEVRNGNGVAMTSASGLPYNNHGQPRMPTQPMAGQFTNFMQQPPPQVLPPTPGPQTKNPANGYTNGGFSPAALSVPQGGQTTILPQTYPNTAMADHQQVNFQPIRTIQPGIAQPNPIAGGVGFGTPLPALVPAGPGGGVSINPGGRGGHGLHHPSAGAHGGSMESLNSTNSSTLSQLSYGSTISTGSGHGPFRSSLKKTSRRDNASVNSESSSKRVRISLGAEQTSV